MTEREIYSKNLKIKGVAYDSCLLEPVTVTLGNGKQREEYGLTLGISEKTAALIEAEIENAQLEQWHHLDPDIISPIYDGEENDIPEPKAINLGTIYKPENIDHEIADGTRCNAIINIRTYEGRYYNGVVVNLAKVFPADQHQAAGRRHNTNEKK